MAKLPKGRGAANPGPKPKATVVIPVRASARLKAALSDAARAAHMAVSPFVAQLLGTSAVLQHRLLDNAPTAGQRLWTLKEISRANLSQIASASQSLERLSEAILRCEALRQPVDDLKVCLYLHAINAQLERLTHLTLVRHRAEDGSQQ